MTPLTLALTHACRHAWAPDAGALLERLATHFGGTAAIRDDATQVLIPMGASGNEVATRMLVALHGGLAESAKAPWWSEFRTLKLRRLKSADLDGLSTLLSAPGLEGLTHVDLSLTSDGDAVAQVLAGPLLPSLVHVRLENAGLSDKGLRALAKRKEALVELYLASNGLTPKGLRSWGKAKTQTAVEVLDVRGNKVKAKGAGDFLQTPGFQNLRWLNVSDNGNLHEMEGCFGDRLEVLDLSYNLLYDLPGLFKKPPAALRELRLSGTWLPEKFISKTLRGALWEQLESLSIANTTNLDESPQLAALFGSAKPRLTHFAGPAGVEDAAFAKAKKGNLRKTLRSMEWMSPQLVDVQAALQPFTQLQALVLQGAPLGDAAAAAVAALNLPLNSLSLHQTHLTAVGAEALAAWEGCSGLQSLRVGDNPLGADGVRTLAAAVPSGSLQELHGLQSGDTGLQALLDGGHLGQEAKLSENALSDVGLRALVEHPQARQVQVLDLCDNPGITAEGLQGLAESAGLPALAVLSADHDLSAVRSSPQSSAFLRFS